MKPTVLVCAKKKDAAAQSACERLVQWLEGNGYETLDVTKSDSEISNKEAKEIKLGVVIGGDGTFLSLARRLESKDAFPLMGVNLGKLGFITEVGEEEMIHAVGEALKKKPKEELRFLLDVEIFRGGKVLQSATAFNDTAITKDAQTTILNLEVHVGGELLSHVRSDGYIVATPTGSTAYALSSGGPLLHPEMNGVVLVPICSHALSARPIVVPKDLEIKILPHEFKGKAYVLFDGQVDVEIKPGDEIVITSSKTSLRLIRTPLRNWAQALRTKLKMD